ncbi:MAG: ATP-binding cassette domain-containing protein [Flavobacteriaceae bacterium]|nr:ATP-binding cassette domain-containing protein [Flavobacteriaceae bacterium]MDH3795542.1 ATP-binding cassette domain-containing protein [Flavobacteriaceae bacterium]
MLSVNQLSKSFGGQDVFDKITFRLNPGDRVGLIGKNGAGKTTLMRMIAGQETGDGGTIAIDKDISIGFLKQDVDFEDGRTVMEETCLAFTELLALEQKIEEINQKLAERSDYDSDGYGRLIHDLSECNERFEVAGGYTYKGETERVLKGLGFETSDFERLTETFSGGWRMRIEIAKLLLQKNDILLLDEPTNHLDLHSIIWLEQFLAQFGGAVMLVSHDQMFLDRVTNRTIEISLGQIYDYKKSYSEFLVLREELREQQRKTKKNQEREIQQAERLINRFRAKSSKAAMAQSLIKKLDKMERIEVDEVDQQVMNVKFPQAERSGKVVAELDGLTKRFDDKLVLEDVELRVEREQKIAFVGRNGEGKTTLAKIIVGELGYEGELKLGHKVKVGYFAQDQADHLDPSKTVLESMTAAATQHSRTKVRDILGAFLFGSEEVDKYIRVLSGGERNRLALARMLLQPFNVLVMDEPTNHLDIASKNVLKKALKDFEGTLIIVSHDREFMQGLTDRVYEFRDRNIKEYLGDIDYYLEEREAESFRDIEKQEKQTKKIADKKSGSSSYQGQKRLKSLKNKLNSLEKKIGSLESEIASMDHALHMRYDEVASDPSFFDQYQEHKNALEKLIFLWESVMIKMEKSRKNLH